MAWTKAKTATVVGIGILLAVGTSTVIGQLGLALVPSGEPIKMLVVGEAN
jgi:putative protein kinase ArgK-like GTPase of G3E family